MDDQTLDRLAESFVSRWRQGQRPTIDEYAEGHPALAGEIRALFPALVALEKAAPGEAPEPQLAGDLGEYRIVREVGRGGMGVVYEAEQTTLRRRVALKVLPRHACRDARVLDRFRREAQAAARLHHSNIVPVYGIGEHAGIHFYAMQFVQGQPLSQVIAELRRLRHGDSSPGGATVGLLSRPGGDGPFFYSVARLGKAVAEALAYAHAQGVIHRDIKPSNLMLDAEGIVWVTDFGLARAEGTVSLTRTGDFTGTLSYMAPERFRGWSDPRSDIYSLGLTLYELLSLRPAFFETDVNRLIRRITESDLPPLRRRRRNIPRDLETIVLSAIARDPADRYATAGDLATDLGLFLADRPIRARRASAFGRVRAWSRRNPLAAGLSALVLLLLLVVAAVALTAAAMLRVERDSAVDNLGRAESAERQLREELRSTHLAQARALRGSRRPGQRSEALDQLARAARIRPSIEIRNEAIAALALIDVRVVRHWSAEEQEVRPDLIDPAHRRFARVEANSDVTLRSLPDGAELLRLPGAGTATRVVRFSADGRRLAAIVGTGPLAAVRVWDLERPAVLLDEPCSGEPRAVDFDGRGRVFVGAPGGAIVIADPATGGRRLLPAGRPGTRLMCVRARSDGERLAAAEEEAAGPADVRLLDAEGRQIGHLAFEDRVREVAWHPRGDRIAIATSAELRIWDVERARLVRLLQGHYGYVVNANFDPTGSRLVSSGWDRRTVVWDVATGEQSLVLPHSAVPTWPFLLAHEGAQSWLHEIEPSAILKTCDEYADSNGVNGAAMSPDGRLMATVSTDGIRVWHVPGVREIAFVPLDHVLLVAFPGPRELTAVTEERILSWQLAPDAAPDGPVIGPVQVAYDERRPAGEEPFPTDRDLRMLAAVREAMGPGPINLGGSSVWPNVSLSPDGRWAATNRWKDKEMRIWDLRSKDCVHTVPVYSGNAAFTPDGKYLVTNGYYEPCRILETTTWREMRQIESEPAGIACRPDGAVLALTTLPSAVALFDVATFAPAASLESSGFAPGQLQFGPDGSHVIVMQAHRVLVWDLAALKDELAKLHTELGLPAWTGACPPPLDAAAPIER